MSEVTNASSLSHVAIREYAERIAKHYEVYDRAGTADVRELVRKLGGTVDYADTRESLNVRDIGDFTIYLPHMTSSRRDRFTIAHELGHYFVHYLHPRTEGSMRFGRGDRNLAETQANVFASSMLMPAEQFERAWTALRGDAFQVAQVFDVSPAAAKVRAEVLGLTPS